jgi:ABC-type Fe3+/spermidine/putrescine transport system ATPase subunit
MANSKKFKRLEVRNVVKSFGEVLAVDDISFAVDDGEFFTLLGPSGCGKTTILRCIAGLEKINQGEILVSGKKVASTYEGIFVPPERRRMSMVFQSYAIWPHMTVAENIAYGLEVRKFSKREIKEKVREILGLVGLPGMEERYATKLSGGQQQRVALARSLVIEPDVILLDEPLSNLDAKLRQQMRLEIKEMKQKLGFTAIYVTHDQSEAMVMSDRVVVMDKGKIIQEGKPYDIYGHPANEIVAKFIGSFNFIKGRIVGKNELYQIRSDKGLKIYCESSQELSKGDEVLLAIRPETLKLYEQRPKNEKIINLFEARIKRSIFLGNIVQYSLEVGQHEFKAEGVSATIFEEDKKVFLSIPAKDVEVITKLS